MNSTTTPSSYVYTIDSDPTSGYPRFQNKTGSNMGWTYNRFTLFINEIYRRWYPVIRDKNTVILTDVTNTTTLTSTTPVKYLQKALDSTTNTITSNKLRPSTGTITINTATSLTTGQGLTATSWFQFAVLRDNVWSAEMAGVLQFMLIIYRFRWVSVRCNTPFQWFRPMVIRWPFSRKCERKNISIGNKTIIFVYMWTNR